jgi:hypothetical protein
MDAVAIKKSWANPCITCYEVKVDRQDFLRDEKWPVYMGYCNRFAFACPEGLIQKEELAPEVGLYWYRGEDKPFKIVRHPVYRQVEIPADFFMYIIMCKIQSDRYPFFNDKEEYFKAYVENEKSSDSLGHELSYKIAKELREMKRSLNSMEYEVENAKDALELQSRAIQILHEHGLEWNLWGESKTWVDALEKYMKNGEVGNNYQLNRAISKAQEIMDYLKMIKGEVS